MKGVLLLGGTYDGRKVVVANHVKRFEYGDSWCGTEVYVSNGKSIVTFDEHGTKKSITEVFVKKGWSVECIAGRN